jgi:hypothetical protein
MKNCTECNAEMDATEVVCPQCGHGLKEQSQRKAAAPPPTIDMSDLKDAWPTMTPAARRQAIRTRILGPDRGLLARFKKALGIGAPPAPPAARRVAARAMALAAVVWRAHFEINLPDEPAVSLKEQCHYVLNWLRGLGIGSELEPPEYKFLQAPPGGIDHRLVLEAAWRCEGLAVLAWALGRFELPSYDEVVWPEPAQASVGFGRVEVAREILDTASLRPVAEIDRYATCATVVTWRIRTFRLAPLAWDLATQLRGQASFTDSWLDGLRLVDGDLAIGDQAIAEAPPDKVESCERSAVQRHIAAYWLQGDNHVYSKVDPSTLLSAC